MTVLNIDVNISDDNNFDDDNDDGDNRDDDDYMIVNMTVSLKMQ